METCSTCGHKNPDGSRFCNGCGAQLANVSAAVREERRIVTVLFANIAGFTARAEAGENERALPYLLLAAEQAGRGWAKDEAAALYGEALELVGDDPERRRVIVRKQALALAALQHAAQMRHQSRRLETDAP
jgi:hypothetical protein